MSSSENQPAGLRDRKRMLVESGKRIARFLALPRIYEFPAHPMAPFLKRCQPRRFCAFDSDALEYSAEPTSRWLPIHPAKLQISGSLVSPGFRDGDRNAADLQRRFVRGMPASQLRAPSAVIAAQQYGASNTAVSDKGNPGAPMAASATLEAEPPDVRQASPGVLADPLRRFGAGAALPSAFLAGPSDNLPFPGPEPWRPPVAGPPTDRLPQNKAVGASDRQAEPDHSLNGEDGFAFGRSNKSVSEDGGVSSASRGFTLHLDGSALGRWTVDHLQRTLSKPAAGMTGVDPRAVVPRSRVSPF